MEEEAGGFLQDDEAEEAEVRSEPLDASPHTFWYAPAGLPDLALHFDAPPADALPVKRWGRPPFWRASTVRMPDFRELMEESYGATAACALRLVMGEMGEEE